MMCAGLPGWLSLGPALLGMSAHMFKCRMPAQAEHTGLHCTILDCLLPTQSFRQSLLCARERTTVKWPFRGLPSERSNCCVRLRTRRSGRGGAATPGHARAWSAPASATRRSRGCICCRHTRGPTPASWPAQQQAPHPATREAQGTAAWWPRTQAHGREGEGRAPRCRGRLWSQRSGVQMSWPSARTPRPQLAGRPCPAHQARRCLRLRLRPRLPRRRLRRGRPQGAGAALPRAS